MQNSPEKWNNFVEYLTSCVSVIHFRFSHACIIAFCGLWKSNANSEKNFTFIYRHEYPILPIVYRRKNAIRQQRDMIKRQNYDDFACLINSLIVERMDPWNGEREREKKGKQKKKTNR